MRSTSDGAVIRCFTDREMWVNINVIMERLSQLSRAYHDKKLLIEISHGCNIQINSKSGCELQLYNDVMQVVPFQSATSQYYDFEYMLSQISVIFFSIINLKLRRVD